MNKDKVILDLCGGTGAWSKPYKEAGYDVRNITYPKYDIRLYNPPKNVYGILAAPPCTMFSFARTNAKKSRNLHEGMSLVLACLRVIWDCQYQIEKDTTKRSPLKFWALENPYYGMLRWFLGEPPFIFNPWEFGDPYQKRTAIWGYFKEPQFNPDRIVRNSKFPKFDYMKSKDIHPNYFGRLGRKNRRAIIPPGFARAFFEANQ